MLNLTISVIIPSYNRALVVGRAIKSALAETLSGDEILVVDDGSTDDTAAVIREFNHERIRVIRQPNAGAGAARNRGTLEASKDLVAYLDSDDEWLPGKIALQRRFMEQRGDVLFCFTDFAREFGGQRHHRSIRHWHTDLRPWEQILGPAQPYSTVAELPGNVSDFAFYTGNIYRGEMHTNYVLTSCMIAKRRQAGDALHFSEGVKTFEDWECFGRLARRGTAAFLDCETAVQFAHPGPRLTDSGLLACAESRLVVLARVWGADPEFMASYGDEYRTLVRQQRLNRIRGLLAIGDTREARLEMSGLSGVPVAYQTLSRLPAGMLTSFINLRSAMRSRLSAAARDSHLEPA